MMFRMVLWLLAGLISIAITALLFFPSTWLSTLLQSQTAGRLTLGDAQGTLWRGSAFIGAAPSGQNPVTPLLPGRFAWKISPFLLLGKIDVQLENAAALSNPVHISGSWYQLQISPATITLPAERLSALGAPLNTIQPSGQMRLAWQPMQLTFQNGQMGMTGLMNLELNDISSRLSPIKPLGAYNLEFDWNGQQAQLKLNSVKGPMLLEGSGKISNGRMQFSGTAQAENGQEQRLANLLNLLGQRRNQGGKEVIGLEFK